MSVTYNLQDNAPHVKLGVPVFHAYKDLVGAYCAWKCTFNITRGSENISKYAIVVDKCNVTTDKTLSGVNWFNIWYSSTKDMHKTCGIETPAKDNNNNVYWNYEY